MDNTDVYVAALLDSLRKKQEVLEQLLILTKEQANLLEDEDLNVGRFDEIVNEKGDYIQEILDLNQGFDRIFADMGDSLKSQKEKYRSQIMEMQNLIRVVTDQGVSLERAEAENKEKFNLFLKKNRDEIRAFKQSNRTATTYYQNMANQHREWQSYFMDKKK